MIFHVSKPEPGVFRRRLAIFGKPTMSQTQDVPTSFYLQVDGVGTYLVLASDRFKIGPIGSGKTFDLPLMMEPSYGETVLEREDEDFFVSSKAPLAVNGKTEKQALLHDGDEIAIGPRCRLKFKVPNPASATALIELKGARSKRMDLRGVLLCDGAIVIAAHAGAHVPCYDVAEPVVLRIGTEGINLRYKDLKGESHEEALSLGQYVRVERLGLALSES